MCVPIHFHSTHRSYLNIVPVIPAGTRLDRPNTLDTIPLMSTATHSRTSPTLGCCPDCTTEIASYDVLIEYETSERTPAIWAECPECMAVVHPE